MAKKKPSGRGGRRAGAGRKPADASGTKHPKTVWLTPAEITHCERLSGGTTQDGIRRLIAESMGR